MSGHSKWATIKRKKGAIDKAKGKTFAKLARQRGHKLGSWDGFDTPILDVPTGNWFILTSDGRKVKGLPKHFRN